MTRRVMTRSVILSVVDLVCRSRRRVGVLVHLNTVFAKSRCSSRRVGVMTRSRRRVGGLVECDDVECDDEELMTRSVMTRIV